MGVVQHMRRECCISEDNCNTFLMNAGACRRIVASEDLSNASSDSGKRILLTFRAPVAAGIDHSGDQGGL